MSIKYNPFYYGGIIKESRMFVGRKREVAEICEAIATSASVSLVGERRIGKSSLLRYLADPSVKQKNGLDVAHFVFSYFDFLGYPSITPTELWQRLLAEMISQIADPGIIENIRALLSQATIQLTDLEVLFKNLKEAGLNSIILFDEFDTAAANQNFDQAFFGGLRNLSKYALSFIIASHRSLSELQYAHPEAIVSPFFNMFRRITLGGFTPDEVKTLLDGSLENTGIVFGTDDLDFLDALADSHPFFLQMAAYFLFDAYRFHYFQNGKADYRWIEDRIWDNSTEHFRYYWEGSEVGEKLILATLSLLDFDELNRYRLYPSSDDLMLRRLRERVLVVNDQKNTPRLFSNLFSQWIVQTISFVPSENIDDFKANIENAKIKGFRKVWLDTTERVRRGFAWIDVKAIIRWLLVSKGADSVLDWITRLLKLIRH
jgi:hypothetical protein